MVVSRPVGGILSGGHETTWVAIHLSGLPGIIGRATRSLLGLAPGGVYRAVRVAPNAGALLPHRFTLTCDRCRSIGGLLSVALSVASRRLAVSQHPALWSPDLPRPSAPSRGPEPRPPSRLTAPNASGKVPRWSRAGPPNRGAHPIASQERPSTSHGAVAQHGAERAQRHG